MEYKLRVPLAKKLHSGFLVSGANLLLSFVLLPERILFFCEEVFSPIRPYAGTPIRWSFLVAAPLRYYLTAYLPSISINRWALEY
jgi:hypothetical protein